MEKADIQDQRQICDAQMVINEASTWIRKFFETVKEGEQGAAVADMKWKDALEKSKQEKEADERGQHAKAKSLRGEKSKWALEALEGWRQALRIFTQHVSGCEDSLIELRMKMAEACDLVQLKMECQIYLLSAMRVTAKSVAQCCFSDTSDREKFR